MKKHAPHYLPLDCPQCGRRRLLASVTEFGSDFFVASQDVSCEKCGWCGEDG